MWVSRSDEAKLLLTAIHCLLTLHLSGALNSVFVYLLYQVDAMKVGVKEFKQAYKNVNIDKIEVAKRSRLRNK